jgi:hypothetical protein
MASCRDAMPRINRTHAIGATVHFKYRPLTKTGEGDWSQPVSLLVQ